MTVVLPLVGGDPNIGGTVNRQNGGFQYGGPGEDTHLLGAAWPVTYPNEDDWNQGIALDPLDAMDVTHDADYEGPPAQFYNGGAIQDQPSYIMAASYTANPVDEVVTPWSGTGPSPYQVDYNMIGPVSGRSEGMTGATLQPNYDPQGQYGASTGGGTSAHETVTAYYQSQADQVQRNYSAAALFASV